MHDIYQTCQVIGQSLKSKFTGRLGNEKIGLVRGIMKACHKKLAKDLERAISEFNQEVCTLRAELAFRLSKAPASLKLIGHVLEQAYSRTVAPESHLLRSYEGFSNNVYGEIKLSFTHDLIVQMGLRADQVFLDMGSGIGNVVLQVAAECLCESYGIEIMTNPAELGKRQMDEFVARMAFYGEPCGPITLTHGDFLDDPVIDQVIPRADVIFVNK